MKIVARNTLHFLQVSASKVVKSAGDMAARITIFIEENTSHLRTTASCGTRFAQTKKTLVM